MSEQHTIQIETAPRQVMQLGQPLVTESRYRCSCGSQGRWEASADEAQFMGNVHRNDVALDAIEAAEYERLGERGYWR